MKQNIKPLNPATVLMHRLKYPQKFGLISTIFILPIALLMYLLFSEIQSQVNFAAKEQLGTIYLRSLQPFSRHIFQLRSLRSNLRNEKAFSQEIITLEAKVNTELKTLEDIDRVLGKSLSTEEYFQTIRKAWEVLQKNQSNWSLETKVYYYENIITLSTSLRRQVGNQSNLILDPDLDSYYMMDLTLLKIPELQKSLVEIQTLSQEILQTKQLTSNDRRQLITLVARLESHIEELKNSMQVAFNNNPTNNLQPKVGSYFNTLVENLDQLLYLLKQPIASAEKIQPETSYLQAIESMGSSVPLWQRSLDGLDILLQSRINNLRQRQFLLMVFVIFVLAVVIYLFVGFYRSVMQTVGELRTAAKGMVQGNKPEEQIVLTSQDELSEVVHAFNDVAGALVEANQEIMSLNDRLKAENLRMSAELEVTRRLQQMILPRDEELSQVSGLDIAGFMQPAAEVGGDYYDVLQQDGKVKIGIGDVTGHGLESGMVMIMAQTAVRTLLANGETDSVRLLNTVNQIIYDNTRRMQSHKNMTLMLLDYEAGMLRLSGQHEDLIIVRQDGRVEPIDTFDLGFPLGIESDISSFVAETNVQLESGDIAVLYTDGISEAMNLKNQQYGLAQMHEVIRQHRAHTASEIRHAVIDNLKQHIGEQIVFDDITLLVLKQQ